MNPQKTRNYTETKNSRCEHHHLRGKTTNYFITLTIYHVSQRRHSCLPLSPAPNGLCCISQSYGDFYLKSTQARALRPRFLAEVDREEPAHRELLHVHVHRPVPAAELRRSCRRRASASRSPPVRTHGQELLRRLGSRSSSRARPTLRRVRDGALGAGCLLFGA